MSILESKLSSISGCVRVDETKLHTHEIATWNLVDWKMSLLPTPRQRHRQPQRQHLQTTLQQHRLQHQQSQVWHCRDPLDLINHLTADVPIDAASAVSLLGRQYFSLSVCKHRLATAATHGFKETSSVFIDVCVVHMRVDENDTGLCYTCSTACPT
jgi:hypothetical protein